MQMKRSFFRRFMRSPFLEKKSVGGRIAYLAVITAFVFIANTFFEFRMFETQYSLTFFVASLAGLMLGAGNGFIVCFVGDLLGFMYNSWGAIYMPWVGISTATVALISGMVFTFFKPKWKAVFLWQALFTVLLSFLICTVCINSTGFYFYNKVMGFSTAFIDYATEAFGAGASYFAYLAYRLIFKGQILVNVLNGILFFIAVPVLRARIKGIFSVDDGADGQTQDEKPIENG